MKLLASITLLCRKICFFPLILFCLFSISLQAQDQKPNILFIMSDDHTTQAVGAYGSRLARLNPTPVLDQLAAEGMLYERVFCTNSICTPSRATIISGQYPQTNGVLDLDHQLPIEKQYLPIEMKKLGYTTAMVGKWHLKNEPANFDYYNVLVGKGGQGSYFDPVLADKDKGNWPDNKVSHTGHSTDIITDLSLEYLEKRDRSKPFFLMHHYKAPHDNFEYAPRYEDYLADVEIPEPSSLYAQPSWGSVATRGEEDALRHLIGTSVSPRHKRRNYVNFYKYQDLEEKEATHKAYQTYLKHYLRCVKGVDDNLGRLFDYLKREGLWENTIIIYTGDQGFMLGEHDLIDKRWMYEESMRMPFLVHYPEKIKAGGRSKLLINNADFAPTMLEMAGGKVPDYMQGMSFKQELLGEEISNWRDATYYRYWMHMIHHEVPAHFGIRTDRYKLIFYYSSHYRSDEESQKFYWWKQYSPVKSTAPIAWEFYDLENDPDELHNRYHDPAYQEIVVQLKVQLAKERVELKEGDENFPKIKEIVEANWDK
ncbi:MAG: sulfatase [Bacteroidota bacterium]